MTLCLDGPTMQYGSPRSPTNGVGMDLDSDPSSTQLPVVPNKQEEADRVRSLHGDSVRGVKRTCRLTGT